MSNHVGNPKKATLLIKDDWSLQFYLTGQESVIIKPGNQ